MVRWFQVEIAEKSEWVGTSEVECTALPARSVLLRFFSFLLFQKVFLSALFLQGVAAMCYLHLLRGTTATGAVGSAT